MTIIIFIFIVIKMTTMSDFLNKISVFIDLLKRKFDHNNNNKLIVETILNK